MCVVVAPRRAVPPALESFCYYCGRSVKFRCRRAHQRLITTVFVTTIIIIMMVMINIERCCYLLLVVLYCTPYANESCLMPPSVVASRAPLPLERVLRLITGKRTVSLTEFVGFGRSDRATVTIVVPRNGSSEGNVVPPVFKELCIGNFLQTTTLISSIPI